MVIQQARIDSQDVYQNFNLIFRNGLKNLETPPNPKDPVTQTWPEINGSQYLLSDKVDDITLELDCFIESDLIPDALSKKDNFFLLMNNGQFKELFVYKTNKTYHFKYNKQSNFKMGYTTTGYGISFTIEITILMDYLNQITQLTIIDGNG